MPLTREQIEEARNWIADCQWADEVEVAELTDEEIVRGIRRHYDGGLTAFIESCEPVSSK
jgi:hypothetical protein